MSYFERIGSNISNKSKELVQKAKDASEVSSLNSIIRNETQKIELNYKMIGKLYFEKYGHAPADDFSDAVSSIRESMEKITQTQEMIKKIKIRRCCPNCMAPFKSGSLFCAKCGTKLAIEQKNTLCFKCGAPIYEGAQFCEVCGVKLSDCDKAPENVPEQVIAIEEKPVQPEAKAEKKVCPSCGAVSDDELAVFCNDCGTKIG